MNGPVPKIVGVVGTWSRFHASSDLLLEENLGIRKNVTGNGTTGKIELFTIKVVIHVIWANLW